MLPVGYFHVVFTLPAEVAVDDATRDALVSLGWTPPDGP